MSKQCLVVCAVLALVSSCAPVEEEAVSGDPSALITNGGFEVGAAGAPPQAWAVSTFLNATGITVQSPQTIAGLNWTAGGTARTTTLNAGGPSTQPDPTLGPAASLRWPRYGRQCAIVNATGTMRNVNMLSQTMTIGAADVDPADGQVHVRFVMAPVLQNATHVAAQQPYYFVLVTNVTRGALLYSDFNLSALGGSWHTIDIGGVEHDYLDWTLVDVSPGAAAIAIGDMIQVQVIASGCQPSAHWAQVYLDGFGPTVPGISVEATGPAQANAGTVIAYTLTYRNGSPAQSCTTSANCAPNTQACVAGLCSETAVSIDFPTPPGTLFVGFTSPAGATCTTPTVGTAGIVTCFVTNPMPPGAISNFVVRVAIDAAATGDLVASGYGIQSTQEPRLAGPGVHTRIGCSVDADCPSANWCNEAMHACVATLANGTPLPNDPPHVAPTLNGTCSAAAGALVCASGVCDVTDNRCGYRNGDGPCNAGNAIAVCRAHVCDPDGRCGLAGGDGPCDATNGNLVCRSTACSVTGVCEPLGGCEVDADCATGRWCDETSHVCAPTLDNGMPLPTDPAHVGPTLDGTCTSAAAALVCTSGACDAADNRCGYADTHGPCTSSDGATVCRSTACSVDGNCVAMGGCNVDADCTTGTWCNESMHACLAALANGASLPVDPAHGGIVLDGMCSAAAGALVCVSGVCDTTDDRCGYARGDGPCTAGDGAVTCRSMLCGTTGAPAGLCVDCVDDTTCASPTPTCDVSRGVCVQCTASSAGSCDADMPVCDAATETCVACAGDFGASGASTCPTAALPFCTAQGACDRCATDADCRAGAHAGPNCDAASGACGTQCTSDAQCASPTPTCDAATHMCVAPAVDAGLQDAGARDAGGGDSGAPDAGARDAGARDAGPIGNDGSLAGMDAGTASVSTGGCSCRAVGGRGSSRSLFGVLVIAAVLARRRRR